MKKMLLLPVVFFCYFTFINAQPGNLDSSFGKNGTVTANFSSLFYGTVIQPDGKIVVSGVIYKFETYSYFLARYNIDGSLDKTFNGTGKVKTKSFHYYLAIQNDGKIVGAGYDSAIARYNTDGSLDKSFGKGGISFNGFPVFSVAIQNDGKIVVVGWLLNQEPFYYSTALARYNRNGTLDSGFSEDGIQITDFFDKKGNHETPYLFSLGIQHDGKIVVASRGSSEGGLISRYNTDGSLDSKRHFHFADKNFAFFSMVIGNNDKIVTSGNIFRIDSPLSVIQISNFDGSNLMSGTALPIDATLLAVQSNGKIILAGDNSLACFNADATLDSTFGNNGEANIEGVYFSNDIAVTDDKLYVAGTGQEGEYQSGYGVILRYLTDNKVITPPGLSILKPADNDTFLAPANIHLAAAVKDPDSVITKVNFYNGSKLLISIYEPPYTYLWTKVPAGNYLLTATAIYDKGLEVTSAPVHISVVPNKPPVVSIIKPADNEGFAAPAFIHFEAAASDSDGRITRVEFYNGSALLRTEYKYPYTYVWKNVPAGTYTITAVATDNWGAQTTSAPVTVRVTSASAIVSNRPYSQNEKIALNDALSLRLSPNPAHSVLNIFTNGLPLNKPVTLSIISTAGNVLKTINISNRATQLDVSSLTSGVYIIKIVSENRVLYKQFVKL